MDLGTKHHVWLKLTLGFFSSFITYHPIVINCTTYSMNTTNEKRTVCPFRAHDFIVGFKCGSCCSIFSVQCFVDPHMNLWNRGYVIPSDKKNKTKDYITDVALFEIFFGEERHYTTQNLPTLSIISHFSKCPFIGSSLCISTHL